MNVKPLVFLLIGALYLNGVCMKSEFNLFSSIKTGIQKATQLLGLDATSGIAELVAETFGDKSLYNKKKKVNSENAKPSGNKSEHFFSGFMKLIGLTTGKLSAVAINGIVFLAQMINTSLKIGKKQKRESTKTKITEETLNDWFYSNPKFSKVINFTQNEDISELMIQYIREKTYDEETACVQLLLCKVSPILKGMQKTIQSKKKSPKLHLNGESDAIDKNIFNFMPTIQQMVIHGTKCEKRFTKCNIDSDLT